MGEKTSAVDPDESAATEQTDPSINWIEVPERNLKNCTRIVAGGERVNCTSAVFSFYRNFETRGEGTE